MKRRAFALILAAMLWLPISQTFAQDGETAPDPWAKINSGFLSALKFRGIGPAFMSGRIGDIAVDPVDRSTWYIAASSGGVWKTENAGVTWRPIFDGYASYSIGCLAIDPQDRFTIWVGTGENNSQRSVGYGDGLYKSVDGGASFKKVGLDNSEHIGMIAIDPTDSQTVYVAAQGPLWKEGGDRGLYKTTDGGSSWKKVLEISENTGVNEVHLDPSDPQTLYASSYQRRRHTWVLIDGGPESGLHKSTDGGETWKAINRGLPGGDKGRIGMDVSPINPSVLYAVVEAGEGQGGFYRSENRGESWQKMSSYVSGSPQYYQEIVACPHKLDRIYSLDTYNQVSEDGGRTFQSLGENDKHVDNHALVIDPNDPEHLLIGCDGGLYETWDRGATYDFKANLPLTQFYKVAVSNEKPFYFVYGGTQDNATQGGPSQTRNNFGIRNSDWIVTVFGDGFDPAVDPEDPDTIYSQSQYGGLVRFNRKTGERVDIRPQPEPNMPPLRWNWDSALAISPHDPHRVYYGSQILFQSDDRGNSWKAISEDLSRNMDRNKLKVMGRVWGVDAVAKNASTSLYGTIVSISESPQQEGLIYVGTDDGMVQITEDGGETWRAVSAFEGLDVPEFGYINDIEADLHDPDTVYVAVNNHKRGDFRPYIVKSTDRGNTWSTLHSDLPQRGSVYCLAQDHQKPELLFCGTEFGCYASLNGGQNWIELSAGLPTIAIRDIEIQREENDLVLASFGRGFFIMDDYDPLRRIDPTTTDQNVMMPIADSQQYPMVAPLALGGRAFQGANYYLAPNPEYGATFTYHLAESLKTAKQERQATDRQKSGAGKDTPYPTWEQLKAEDREEGPKVFLTIRDSDGKVVQRLNGSTSSGLHRSQWNLRHAGFGRGGGPMAIPGEYSVTVSKLVDGEETELIPATPFEVSMLELDPDHQADPAQVLAYLEDASKLANAVNAATSIATQVESQLTAVRSAIQRDLDVDPAMDYRVRQLEIKLMDIMEAFDGDPTKARRNEAAETGLNDRIRNMMFGALGSTEGPTETHRRQYEIAKEEYEESVSGLRNLIDEELPKLFAELDEAGVPWTPGRTLPKLD